MNEKRYRVVQWGTGNVGSRSLRAVIEHPQLDLVGVHVYSDTKAGRDAGELCGLAPVGVTATNDVEAILAAHPDCVLYMPDRMETDVLCRLLESGANVVSTRDEFRRPASIKPEVRERLEGACAKGGTSLHGTGSSPGFSTEALPITLLSIQRRLDRLTIDEFADISSRNSPEMIFQVMGFGLPPEQFDPGRGAAGAHSFGPSMQVVADAVGLPIDSVDSVGEVAVARERVEIAAGTIEAGSVGAQRMVVTCRHNDEPTFVFRANWYLTTLLEPEWDLRDSGWRMVVDGDAPLEVNIRFPVSEEDYPNMTPGLTAHRPVNAVPYVCEAEPGLRTTVDLGQVVANLSR